MMPNFTENVMAAKLRNRWVLKYQIHITIQHYLEYVLSSMDAHHVEICKCA